MSNHYTETLNEIKDCWNVLIGALISMRVAPPLILTLVDWESICWLLI